MLKRFEVQGYKNFDHTIALNLADTRDYKFSRSALTDSESPLVKCGLIYGKNASGKTNLGKALFDIKYNIQYAPGYKSNIDDYLTATINVNYAVFSYTFQFDDNEVVYEYEKTAPRKLARESLYIDDRIIFEYDFEEGRMEEGDLPSIGANTLNWEFFAGEMSVLNYICNNTPMALLGPVGRLYSFVKNMAFVGDQLMCDRDFVSQLADRVINAHKVEELERFFNSFGINERLCVIDSPSGQPVLYFNYAKPIRFSENCSNGTIALLRLFNYNMIVGDQSLLFVDEFDAFYHHDLAERVIDFFKEGLSGQTIAASHNTDLFSNKVLRPDCLFILSRDRITSAANATRRELREGHNLEKLYKAGEFGG